MTSHLDAILGKTRFKIVQVIMKKPYSWVTINTIMKELNLARETVSWHLQVLKESGMVFTQKHGRRVYWHCSSKLQACVSEIGELSYNED